MEDCVLVLVLSTYIGIFLALFTIFTLFTTVISYIFGDV